MADPAPAPDISRLTDYLEALRMVSPGIDFEGLSDEELHQALEDYDPPDCWDNDCRLHDIRRVVVYGPYEHFKLARAACRKRVERLLRTVGLKED